ncbi:MAG: Nif3-like dinuclear metal center hexameric protein, partial [Deferrisomatales bacterium]
VVAAALEAVAPLELAETWDRPGLQVGDPSATVERALVALDPSLAAAREASLRGFQLLVTHHPLFLKPLHRLDASTAQGRVAFELVRAGVGLYSAHTNLDRAEGGVNDALARRLGLGDLRPLGPGVPQAGGALGRVGRLAAPAALGPWCRGAARCLGSRAPRLVGDPEAIIEHVAVCGGSGASLWPLALQAGAQLLVTGDIRYHEALEAREAGLALLDVGHGPSEQVAVEVLAQALSGWRAPGGRRLQVEILRQPEPFETVTV